MNIDKKKAPMVFLYSKNTIATHMHEVHKCYRMQWEALKKCRTLLTQKEYTIIKMRTHERMTLEEVCKKLSVTRERVRQIEALAIEKIQQAYRETLQ